MIDISWIIDECSATVESKVYVQFNYEKDMLHVEFEWSGFEEHNILTRLYTRQMVDNCRCDLSECIIDDFKRHTTGEAK